MQFEEFSYHTATRVILLINIYFFFWEYENLFNMLVMGIWGENVQIIVYLNYYKK